MVCKTRRHQTIRTVPGQTHSGPQRVPVYCKTCLRGVWTEVVPRPGAGPKVALLLLLCSPLIGTSLHFPRQEKEKEKREKKEKEISSKTSTPTARKNVFRTATSASAAAHWLTLNSPRQQVGASSGTRASGCPGCSYEGACWWNVYCRLLDRRSLLEGMVWMAADNVWAQTLCTCRKIPPKRCGCARQTNAPLLHTMATGHCMERHGAFRAQQF